MKKIIVFIFLFYSFLLFSDGYDFSIGGSYGFGVQGDTKVKSSGLYEQLTIPISFSYYPGNSEIFSFGFKNKIGYRVIIYGADFSIKDNERKNSNNVTYKEIVKFDNPINQHELYENLSFLLKTGRYAKFIFNFGISARLCFLCVPNGTFDWEFYDENNNYSDLMSYVTPGFYSNFTLGQSLEFGLELINKPQNFSLFMGFPMEFQIPCINTVNYTTKYVKKYSKSYNYTVEENRYDNFNWLNASIGMEFTFSFYTYKKIK